MLGSQPARQPAFARLWILGHSPPSAIAVHFDRDDRPARGPETHRNLFRFTSGHGGVPPDEYSQKAKTWAN
jgi:hypothetical protein